MIFYNFYLTIKSLQAGIFQLHFLTAPTGKPVGFWLPSVACNRTSFSDFGVTSVNLFESGLLLPSSLGDHIRGKFLLCSKEVQSISLISFELLNRTNTFESWFPFFNRWVYNFTPTAIILMWLNISCISFSISLGLGLVSLHLRSCCDRFREQLIKTNYKDTINVCNGLVHNMYISLFVFWLFAQIRNIHISKETYREFLSNILYTDYISTICNCQAKEKRLSCYKNDAQKKL